MTLKDLLFEHTEVKKVAPPSVPVHTNPVAATVPSMGFKYSVPSEFTPTSEGTGIYEQIKAKTDFDGTQAGQILNKYLSPLASLTLDKSIKLKMAIAQASQIDGLDAARVLATFDGLKVSLQNEIESFNSAASDQTEKEITARNTRMVEITDQIKKLQTEQQQLVMDLSAAQTKIATTTQQFTLAASRRGTEIDQQKVEFAGMLK